MAGEGLDLIAYFFGFWMFVFSRDFREDWLSDWAASSMLERVALVLQAVGSILIGVIAPAALLIWLLTP